MRLHSRANPILETIINHRVNITKHDDGEQQCEELVSSASKKESVDPGEINRLRRKLAMEDPSCYQRSYSIFAQFFRSRLKQVTSHLHLHIPKAGGTSLCELASSYKETITSHNCWADKYFQPVWCCDNFTNRKVLFKSNDISCDVYKHGDGSLFPEFVMNENYLDYPLCLTQRIHSITLRNPVDRAMSQERHLTGYRINNPMSNETFSEKLNLVRHNYITWALSAGAMTEDRRFSSFLQNKELTSAKDVISRFDFLIDYSQNNTCNNAIFNLMGFGNSSLGHARKGSWSQLAHNLTAKSQYHKWNSLDLDLYEFSEQLMDVDCEFFVQLNRESKLAGRSL